MWRFQGKRRRKKKKSFSVKSIRNHAFGLISRASAQLIQLPKAQFSETWKNINYLCMILNRPCFKNKNAPHGCERWLLWSQASQQHLWTIACFFSALSVSTTADVVFICTILGPVIVSILVQCEFEITPLLCAVGDSRSRPLHPQFHEPSLCSLFCFFGTRSPATPSTLFVVFIIRFLDHFFVAAI